MKVKGSRIIPEHVHEFTSHILCDICKNKIDDKSYSTDEVIIKYDKGSRYPEYSSGIIKEYDICGKCFEDKLVKWFEEQGISAQESEY